MQHPQLLTPPPPFTANQQQIVSQALAILETQLKHRPYTFNAPEAVKTWLKLHLQPQRRECFMVLFLDNRHRLVDIRVLDHLIVGDAEPLSLAERGWLPC
ncbi:hypothetical protein [Serratia fonticola]